MPTEIYWRRQDNAVLPTNTSIYKGHTLMFPKVTKEHRGTYYCVATNVVGQGARRNVDVEVLSFLFQNIVRMLHFFCKSHRKAELAFSIISMLVSPPSTTQGGRLCYQTLNTPKNVRSSNCKKPIGSHDVWLYLRKIEDSH